MPVHEICARDRRNRPLVHRLDRPRSPRAAGKGLTTILVSVMACGTLLNPSTVCAQTIEDRARAAAAAATEKTGSSDALRENYLTPGLGGEPISTLDASRSFTPSLACRKTASLLQVLVQPGSGGDLASVRVSQDTDLDGAYDATMTLGRPVSGICANGIVSCNPGTWQQCHFLRWEAGADRTLRLEEVEMPELSACYCINNSCGSNLAWSNLGDVLKDLGGGMVGALTTADPRMGVAEARVSGPIIEYAGAQTSSCSSASTVTQTVYRAQPQRLQGDAANLASSSDIFQKLAASSAGSGKAQQTRRCTIERQVRISRPSMDDIVSRLAGGYSEIRSGTGAVEYLMGSPRDDSLSGGSCSFFDYRLRLHVSDPGRITDARLVEFFADDWVQVRIDGTIVGSGPLPWTTQGLPPARCERKATYTARPDLDIRRFLTPGDHEIWLRAAVADDGEAFARLRIEVDDSCGFDERIIDQCSGYAGDPRCNLQDESVDGVETFRNGVGTGLRPLAQTRRFGADRCTLSLTRDFFSRERLYACQIDTAASAQPDLSRGAYIIDHSTESVLSDQLRGNDSRLVQTTAPFSLPERGTVAKCEAMCRTRAPRVNNQAAPSGVTGTLQNDPVGWDTFYHTCSASNECPLGPGEELAAPCGCASDFPEAVAMMQSLRLAGADMVCTSSAP